MENPRKQEQSIIDRYIRIILIVGAVMGTAWAITFMALVYQAIAK